MVAVLTRHFQVGRGSSRVGRRIVALDNLFNFLGDNRFWGRNNIPLFSGAWLLSFIVCIIILRPRGYFKGLGRIITFDTGTGTTQTVGFLGYHWEVSCNLYSFIERGGWVGVWSIIILLKILLIFTFKHIFGGISKGLL